MDTYELAVLPEDDFGDLVVSTTKSNFSDPDKDDILDF